MSSIAGVGGDVPALVCVASAPARHGVVPTQHLELWKAGVRKRQHEEFEPEQAVALLTQCVDLTGG